MTKHALPGLWTVAVAALILIGCGARKEKSRTSDASTEFPREQTLYVGGWEWAAPSTFNCLAGDPTWPVGGCVELMYESLFGYNQMTGELDPLVGRSYTAKGRTIEVVVDERAKWSNGEPVTPEDVKFTYELDKRYPTPRIGNWNYITDVSVADGNRVVFALSELNYNPLKVLDMLAEVSIVPESVYGKLEKDCWVDSLDKGDYIEILNFRNDADVVASGPYTLLKYTDQKIILKRRDDYWGNVKHDGKLPGPKYIIHSLYSSNSHFNSAMVKGHLDLSSNYMPRIWEKAKHKMRAWSTKAPYHQPGSIPTLFMALTVEPLNDVSFRRALAHAVNFDKVNRLAFSNYTPEMKPGMILPFGPEGRYYSEEDAEKYGYSFDLEKARAILKGAGYTWDGSGKLVAPAGKIVRPLTLECPLGWSDWENTIKVVIEGFVAIGIDAREKFVDYGIWDRNVKKGAFDLAMRTTTPELWPSTPWRRFDQLQSAKDWKPVGENMNENFGRYRDDDTERMIRELPKLKDEQKIVEAYRALNRKFMQEVPVLPLMYRPTVFYQFSTQHWEGFPTKENPYAPPQCLTMGAGVNGLWGIKAVKGD